MYVFPHYFEAQSHITHNALAYQTHSTEFKSHKAFILKNIIIISFSPASEQHNFVWLQAVHSCIINDWIISLHF